MDQPAKPEGPFTVDGYSHRPHDSIAAARIFAGIKQGHDHRSMQIRDRHGNIVDLKRI